MYILYIPRSIHEGDPYIYLSIAKLAYSNIMCILLICNFTHPANQNHIHANHTKLKITQNRVSVYRQNSDL